MVKNILPYITVIDFLVTIFITLVVGQSGVFFHTIWGKANF